MTDGVAFSPSLCQNTIPRLSSREIFRSLLTNLPNPVSEVFHSGGVWRRGDERECCVNTFQWLKRGCQAGGLSYSLKVAVGEEDGKTESGVTWKKKRLKIRVCNTRRRANTQTSAAFM